MTRIAIASAALLACTPALPPFDDAGPLDGGRDGAAQPDAAPDAATPCEAEGFAECDPADDIECESYVWADEARCGACGTACDPDRLCVAGACRVALIQDVALGGGHTCVSTTSGHVLCWGRNSWGQLGDGTYSVVVENDRSDAVAVLEIDDAQEIEVEGHTSCAIRGVERVVECWGDNSPARFGVPGAAASAYARPEPLLMDGMPEPIEELDMTLSHLCVRTDTRLLCAGRNSSGQLGQAHTMHSERLVEVAVPGGASRAVTTGGADGYGHTCAVSEDRSVYCFGSNGDGQSGQSDTSAPVMGPTLVPGLTDIDRIDAGVAFTCALDLSGDVYCWGANTSGQLGRGVISARIPEPGRVEGLPAIGSIAAGGQFVLAVSADGRRVFGWGGRGRGQLGSGAETDDVAEPIEIRSGTGVTYEVFAGAMHACILERRSGSPERLLCTGDNAYGQLGRPAGPMGTSFEPTGALP